MRSTDFVLPIGLGAAIRRAAAFSGPPLATRPATSRRCETLSPPPPYRRHGQVAAALDHYPSRSSGRLEMMARGDGGGGRGGGPFGAILEAFDPSNLLLVGNKGSPPFAASSKEDERIVTNFIASINNRDDPSTMMDFFSDDVDYVDTSYYNPIKGKEALSRHFYLHAGSSPLSTLPSRRRGRDDDSPAEEEEVMIVIDDIVSAPASAAGEGTSSSKVCVMYHLATTATVGGGEDAVPVLAPVPDTTAISFYNLEDGKIVRVFDVAEPPSPKPGDSGLKLLKTVSKFIGDDDIVPTTEAEEEKDGSISVVEEYFDAWNRRDMKRAISLFTDDCAMRDLQYDDAFAGRDEYEAHLMRVEDCLPKTFDFVVDDIAIGSDRVGVVWHVENDGSPLAFTRGCSFYTLDTKSGSIKSGFEIPERAPPKPGYLTSLMSKFESEPMRYVPLALWVAYMYVLFVSDGILPGANALALELRTWEEVRDLSLNFFLVAPALKLPFSPVVHPMLEGVFNLLLSWAAMFAGFLSDERRDKPNLLPFGPMLVGMQFLTSGFLLPYLFARTPETTTGQSSEVVYLEDIDGDVQRAVAEWRPLGLFLGGVGTASVFWGLFARPEEFGNLAERYASFVDLLSIDRVGSSFIVDLVIFAAFQGWFVDDDLSRRGVARDDDSEFGALRNAAKYVPFLGLAAYLTLRPPLPTRDGAEQ